MKIFINGVEKDADPEKSLLAICRENNVVIPTLCYHAHLHPEARCRLCLVEMNGKLVTACSTKPLENAHIVTNSERVLKARRLNAELMLSQTPACSPYDDYEVCEIYEQVGLERSRFHRIKNYKPDLGAAVVRDDNKCINCGRCVQVCSEIQAVYAIDFSSRGYGEHVSPYGERNLADVACIKCGQCIMNCPVGAISERSHLEEVMSALKDPSLHVVAQVAPSIRAAAGELFGLPPGTLVAGKIASALRRCGFAKVFDVDLGADMTIMEEASELLKRLEKNENLPMITTCCPGWILMMEHFYQELIPNMSTCKSPHEMLGMLIKTFYAKRAGINPRDIVVVSIMPCTAKKFESTRPELNTAVDYVLTTREFGRLVKMKHIDFKSLPDEPFDAPLGIASGAGHIFGASGGVMEAALRTAYEISTGKQLTKIEFDQLRGSEGIKQGSIIINGKEIRFAAANGGRNIRNVIKHMNNYHFIEMMACPGGCIGGGGQPIYKDPDVLVKRAQAIYQADSLEHIRKSHENPVVKEIYAEFLGHPLSEKAEELLHTFYVPRERF